MIYDSIEHAVRLLYPDGAPPFAALKGVMGTLVNGRSVWHDKDTDPVTGLNVKD